MSCAMLGINSKVVMPNCAPKSKIAATSEYSAEVVLHGENFNDTIAKASEIIEMENRIFIHPFDDEKVIAGQGTIGLEILEDLYDVDNVIVPIGGGGLISGIALPRRGQAVLPSQFFNQRLGFFAGGFKAKVMGTFNVDAGHYSLR